MKFVNRERELDLLNQIAERPGAQFVVLYGRRRIGKTTLITHWFEEHVKENYIYWVAHRSSSEILLKKFSSAVSTCLPGIGSNVRFGNWESALDQVFKLGADKRIYLAIDEFPYLRQSVPEFASLLQMMWDRNAKSSKIVILLSGSHYHMMFKEFLSGNAPLYGRSTADLLLEPIAPHEMELFLPRYSPEQIVETYSIIGGIPKYLEMWDDRRPVPKNIEEVILSPVSIFRQEAIYLIQDEIPEPRTYLAILEAIGSGMKSPKNIADKTGIAINHMGKYLRTLLDLRFIRRILSTDAADRNSSRLSRYEIRDSFLKFYFTYIYTNLELLEQNRIEKLMGIIQATKDAFVEKTGYEELARRLITRLGDEQKLPFAPDHIGRIWNRSVEIDVAAIEPRTRNILLGECKWTSKKVTHRVLDDLMGKSERLPRIKDYKKQFALFSKAGFTDSLVRRASEEKVLLFQGPILIPM